MPKNDIHLSVFDDDDMQTFSAFEGGYDAGTRSDNNVIITDDVIAVVAGKAALATESVASMSSNVAGDIVEALGVKNPTRGVTVRMDEDRVILDLYVTVKYGRKISDIAWDIQENVKRDVENMTGAIVESVNIHVTGVDFSDPPAVPGNEDSEQSV